MKRNDDDIRDPRALVVIGSGGEFRRATMPGDVEPGIGWYARWALVALVIYFAAFAAALLATKVMVWMGAAKEGGAM